MYGMTSDPADDAALLASWCRGEARAAEALYERHGKALLRFATAMLASRQSAEDVVHDTFVELLRRPDRFDAGRGPLVAYLYGIARHRLSRVARLTLREAPLEHEYSGDDTDDDVPQAPVREVTSGADELADRAQMIERVRAAVHDLPVVHREVVALCDLEELPYATVAAILDCPIGTVRSRLHRARALLSTRLATLGTREQSQGNDTQKDTTGSMMLSCRGTLR
jgi:RNA polymerase sigma-70 factor, ECF subfamily